MFKNLEVFKLSHAMASHAAQRQAVTASNMANADTPGYVARDVVPFKSLVETHSASPLQAMRQTRSAHLTESTNLHSQEADPQNVGIAPNGNSVSLEEEMVKAVDAKRQHDRALAIYKSSLNILRSSLGRR